MQSTCEFIERRLKLRVNHSKFAVDLRRLTSRRWGISMERRIAAINRFSRRWTAYFGLGDTPSVFEELDEWLRRRLRQVRWREWKRPKTKRRNLQRWESPRKQAHE